MTPVWSALAGVGLCCEGLSGGGNPLAVKRVVVSNVFSDDNRGGAAITMATVAAIKDAFSDCDVTLVSVESDPERVSEYHRHTLRRFPEIRVVPAPLTETRPRWGGLRAVLRSIVYLLTPGAVPATAEALSEVRDADMVVSKGGHVFIERGGLKGMQSLWLTAFPLVYARRLGIPTVVFCSTVGPFRRRGSLWLNGWMLRRVSLILVRDPLSRASASKLGVEPTRIVEVPDSVFSMDPPVAQVSDDLVGRLGLRHVRFGAMTVRAKGPPEQREAFLGILAEATRVLLDRGIVDRVAVVVQVDGASASDLPDSARFMDLAGDARVVLIHEDLSPEEFVALYGAAAFVIGTRMHSAIFSMVGGTPAVVVALSGEKARGVFEQLKLGDLVVSHRDIDSKGLVALVEAVVGGELFAEQRVREAVSHARRQTSAFRSLLRGLAGE